MWVTEVAQFFALFQLENPGVVEDLGPVGYEGSAGMYVRGSERERPEADSGLPLEYYKSYNLSFHAPYNYFETIWDLSSSELLLCNEIGSGLSDLLANFLDWTGDVEGVTEKNGQYYLNCPLQAFWIAPSCRHNYTRCIPTVVGGQVVVPTFMQWSVAHGLPLAITLVDTKRFPGADRGYIRKHKTLYYWYSPEAELQDLKASRIILPQHNPEDWAKGDYRTDSNKVYVAKLGSPLLRISPRVRAFVQKMQVNEDHIVQLMTIAMEGRVPDPERSYSNSQQGICAWLKANRYLWKSWIPMATDCTAGYGIADAQGMPVTSPAEAVSCEICPAGRFSEVYRTGGITYRCQPCDPGYHQTRAGQLKCVPCDPGTHAAEAGQAFCAACARGSFANLSGSRSCLSCGPAEAWTTSKAEDTGGQERWIEIEGEVCAVPV